MPGSGQLTADSLRALLLPEHNMVKAGHRSCLFSIKPIRKLHESRIFDGTVSEEENNPPSLFVLKSEATAYSCLPLSKARPFPPPRTPDVCDFPGVPSGQKKMTTQSKRSREQLQHWLKVQPCEKPIANPSTPNNQALCLLWRHRVSQWDARPPTALLAWIYLMNKGTCSLHKQDQVELKRNELRKQCRLIPAGI